MCTSLFFKAFEEYKGSFSSLAPFSNTVCSPACKTILLRCSCIVPLTLTIINPIRESWRNSAHRLVMLKMKDTSLDRVLSSIPISQMMLQVRVMLYRMMRMMVMIM